MLEWLGLTENMKATEDISIDTTKGDSQRYCKEVKEKQNHKFHNYTLDTTRQRPWKRA